MREKLNLWTFVGMLAGLLTPDWLWPIAAGWAIVAIAWWSIILLRRKIGGYSVIPVLAILFMGCAASNKALIYTEEGLRSAEQGWDAYYNAEADRCEALYEPKTPDMEACFGKTYDADAVVGKVVESAIASLRSYWRRRAAGEQPDLAQVLRELGALIDDLPPEARTYFDRVRGIP